jgi:tryptophanyl-tRNA synthetase
LHQIYSDEERKEWVQDGCRNARFGCLECKQPLIEAILKEQEPIRKRAKEYTADPEIVRGIISEGCEAARDVARETMDEVRSAMGLNYK